MNEIFLSFFSFPTQLDHIELDRHYYQASIRTYLRVLKELFEKTIENFRNSQKYFAELSQHEGMVAKALRFYNDITTSHFKPLRNHKTTAAIQAFSEIDYDTMLAEFTRRSKIVDSDVKDVMNCTFSSGYERRVAEKSFTSFMHWLSEQSGELERLIRCFVNNYGAELHSYGQYCIREDEFSDKSQGSEHKNLRKMIEIVLTDNVITSKERMMLEFIAENEGLTRADLDRILNEYI